MTVNEDRVLILAPTGRDASLAVQALAAAGIGAQAVDGMAALCARLAEGAGALLIAQEAFSPDAVSCLDDALRAQPPWSDLPIIIFTSGRNSAQADRILESLREALLNVTFLERPLRSVTLLGAVRAALRARQRQYDLRALLRKREQEVQQRDTFLAMLGHELRNPLGIIILAGQMMDRAGDRAFAKERGLIARQSKHLARLVDDLLEVSRITTGKIVLQRTDVDLLQVARTGVQAAEGLLKAQRLDAEVHSEGDPVFIDGDPVRIEQIFTNLLTNAIKYTQPGGRIDVGVGREGNHGVLRLRDTGVGIAPDVLPHVFELFTQAESTLDRSRGGLGIGLTVVRSLVSLHGGEIEAHSEGLGRGSEFVVRLPLRATVELAEPTATTATPSEACRVVVVEDQDDFRELLQSMLQSLGHHVESVSDGRKGLGLLLARAPDAALIDIGLPLLDGYAVAREARAALGPNVFLVAITGYGQPEDRKRALDAGFDLHLTKPVDIDVLRTVLARRQGAARAAATLS